MKATVSFVKAAAVESFGWILLLGGIALMPLPGPGTLLAFGGIVVLSTRYTWARRLRHRAAESVENATAQSVATKKRVVGSFLAALTAMGIGVCLIADPVLPTWIDFEVLGVQFGPRIPAAGLTTGIPILLSGLAAVGVLFYARWRYAPDRQVVPDVEQDLADLDITE